MTHISHEYQLAPAPLVKVSGHNNKSMPHCALQQVRNAFCPIFFFIMPERCIAGDDHTKFNQHAHVLRNSRGQVPSQLTLAWANVFWCSMSNMQFSCLFRVISRTMASCFPGASTSVMCPMFGRCRRSSCLVWRLLQSSDTFRSRAEFSPFVLWVLGTIVGTLVCLCFPVTAFRSSSSVSTGILFGNTSPAISVDVSFDHL